ncbi:MAG TPA: hypothetical protein VK747_16610, partial [Blastocatellia bacterium]|nr:hypothetical protein [Blastocatellia bacterium]
MKTQDEKRFFRSISPIVMAALAVQLLIPIAGFAQTDQGRITGTVRDQTKAVIAAATVAVKNERTGEERTVTKND